MTLNTPLVLQAGGSDPAISYSAQDWRTIFDALVLGTGVTTPADLAVSQRSAGANFSVDIAAGHAIIAGTSVTDQGKYIVQNTATVNLAITGAPGSGTRFDLVYAQVRDNLADGGLAYDWVINKVTGTVGAGLPTTPANAIALAQIGPIVTGTASITNALITSLRTAWMPAGFQGQSADVATQQSTTSTSYTDLATVGPSITVALAAGQRVMVGIAARMFTQTTGSGNSSQMSFAVSGAATQAAADPNGIEGNSDAGSTQSRSSLYLAPSTGVYTFTAKYRSNGPTTSFFVDRRIIITGG